MKHYITEAGNGGFVVLDGTRSVGCLPLLEMMPSFEGRPDYVWFAHAPRWTLTYCEKGQSEIPSCGK